MVPQAPTLGSKLAFQTEIQYQPQTQATYVILNFLVATLNMHKISNLILIKYFIKFNISEILSF